MEDTNKDDLYNSPLHQLELHMYNVQGEKSRGSADEPSMGNSSIFSSREGDRSSVYSFDSVSTNGRLLDRLGLDDEDLFDNGDEAKVALRDSIISLQSNRDVDRPEVEAPKDFRDIASRINPREKPIAPAINMHRYPSTSKGLLPQSESRREHKISIKSVPKSIVLQENKSVDSLSAETFSRSNSISSVNDLVQDRQRHIPIRTDSTRSAMLNRHPSSNNTYSPILSSSKSQSPNPETQSPSKARSYSLGVNNSPILESASPRRVNSDNTNTTTYSHEADSTPEERIRRASELRNTGKHREASYQLQIAANSPFNYPRAMFLYAMALRFGKGLKQNDRSSAKWLCQTILVEANSNNEKLIDRCKRMEPEEMLSVILMLLDKVPPIDPNTLYEDYSKLAKTHGSKYPQQINLGHEHVANAYHELGNAVMHGWGFKSKNELLGIRLISKAGSIGSVTSMTQLGEIWCLKTKYHKKDHHKAAAWLRLGDIFGAHTIGNSWIYKEKYMNAKK